MWLLEDYLSAKVFAGILKFIECPIDFVEVSEISKGLNNCLVLNVWAVLVSCFVWD